MQAVGVRIGDIGIGAFNAARKICPNEQIKDTIDAIGCDAAPFGLRYRLSNVISGRRPVKTGQCLKNPGAHGGPLLAGPFQRGLRRVRQIDAMMFVMLMNRHRLDLGSQSLTSKDDAPTCNSDARRCVWVSQHIGLNRCASVQIMAQGQQRDTNQRKQRFITIAIMRERNGTRHHP